MIVEGLATVFFGLVIFILGLFPDVAKPGWLDDGGMYLAQVWADGLWSRGVGAVVALRAGLGCGPGVCPDRPRDQGRPHHRLVLHRWRGVGRMMLVTAVIVALVLLWLRRRAVRARNLAGLNGTKPVFSVEPPARRIGARKRELL
jgi:hypothetical protein